MAIGRIKPSSVNFSTILSPFWKKTFLVSSLSFLLADFAISCLISFSLSVVSVFSAFTALALVFAVSALTALTSETAFASTFFEVTLSSPVLLVSNVAGTAETARISFGSSLSGSLLARVLKSIESKYG